MNFQKLTNAIRTGGLAAIVAVSGAVATPAMAEQMERIQAGSLVCRGSGGWGAIITSRKEFLCTFAKSDSSVRGSYKGVIEKFGIDLGVTGDTTLVWLVFGPEAKVAGNYSPGSLAGTYGGIGAEASIGVGVGANALVGGGDSSFVLQPVSVQVQTGLSVAAGVQRLTLDYIGPVEGS